MISAVVSYLKFLKESSNQHGIHSPFVYDLVTKCFYDRTNYPQYALMERYRSQLLKDKRAIEVTDFGAGSRVFSTPQRKVKDIAGNAGISRRRARLLMRIVKYFAAGNVLELGTSVGLGTSALAFGNQQAKITTLEGCPNTAAIAKNYLEAARLKNVDLRVGSFEKILPDLASNQYDLIYFDGNHQRDATLHYFQMLLPTAHNDTLWIFDDIHWSAGMEEAWEEIKKKPRVSVTIDTFQWGLVFFRREQAKENFVVRA